MSMDAEYASMHKVYIFVPTERARVNNIKINKFDRIIPITKA